MYFRRNQASSVYASSKKDGKPCRPAWITLAQQQDIIDICSLYGWTGPIIYDGEKEGWLW